MWRTLMSGSLGAVKLRLNAVRERPPDAGSHPLSLRPQGRTRLLTAYDRVFRGADNSQPDSDQEMPRQDRAHFFGVVTQAMRRILVDCACADSSGKRGGGRTKAPLDD